MSRIEDLDPSDVPPVPEYAIDIMGNAVYPGDYFAYAVAAGQAQVLNIYQLDKFVLRKNGYIDTYKRQPNVEEFYRISALPIKVNTWCRSKKKASLYFEFFSTRAVKVYFDKGEASNNEDVSNTI